MVLELPLRKNFRSSGDQDRQQLECLQRQVDLASVACQLTRLVIERKGAEVNPQNGLLGRNL
jgi:hypothetical protein